MKDMLLKLRSEGLSYREIEKKTGVNRGTIAYYCGASVLDNRRERLQRKRREMKAKAVTYKGGACQCCGFDKFLSALEFHHLDPKVKENSIAIAMAKNHSFERIKKELDKTTLLCANCHRGIHSGELSF